MSILMFAVLCAGLAQAETPAAKANDPRLFADYEALVAFLQKTPAYSLDVLLEWKGEDGSHPGARRFAFQLERPGTYRLELRPDAKAAPRVIVVSDGKTVTTLYTPKGLYEETPFTDLLQSLGENPLVGPGLGGSLIDTLLRGDLVEIVKGRVTGGTLVGVETRDGRALRHYRLKWRGDDEELWIGPASEPLIRKLVRVSLDPEAAGANPPRLVTTTTLSWRLGPVPAAAFRLDLPAKARKVDDLSAAIVEEANP